MQGVKPPEPVRDLKDARIPLIQPDKALVELANAQPLQTMAESPPQPSDITNLMFVGAQAQIENAFMLAGWSTAAELNAASKLETIRAVLEARGYSEAPVSTLLLEGRPPDLVFQKQLNTFAKRHHLRIWRRTAEYRAHTAWVSAATHDIDIDFHPETRNFTHKIDPDIDKERAKVVHDLAFTGRLAAATFVDRPSAPKLSRNATGDDLRTDGRMVVLLLKSQ